jgi:hypothetical protein
VSPGGAFTVCRPTIVVSEKSTPMLFAQHKSCIELLIILSQRIEGGLAGEARRICLSAVVRKRPNVRGAANDANGMYWPCSCPRTIP